MEPTLLEVTANKITIFKCLKPFVSVVTKQHCPFLRLYKLMMNKCVWSPNMCME